MRSLKDEEKKLLSDRIARFFKEEFDLDLGLIGTKTILDFFMDTLGKAFHDSALDEAKAFFLARVQDMEDEYDALYREPR